LSRQPTMMTTGAQCFFIQSWRQRKSRSPFDSAMVHKEHCLRYWISTLFMMKFLSMSIQRLSMRFGVDGEDGKRSRFDACSLYTCTAYCIAKVGAFCSHRQMELNTESTFARIKVLFRSSMDIYSCNRSRRAWNGYSHNTEVIHI
jgi:hypothetical protein